MKRPVEKSGGIALLTGSLLMLLTMALHPAGGSLQRLLEMTKAIVISHSIALLAIPFLAVGFWGLTKKLGASRFLPLLSFSIVLTGLLAGMIAATINGLALPIYIRHYKEAAVEMEGILKPIIRYNIALNQAFDFVFLGAVSLSVLLWSIAILRYKALPSWTSYVGMALSLLALGMLASGFVFVNLHGFRLFIFGHVVWMSLIGVALLRSKRNQRNAPGLMESH